MGSYSNFAHASLWDLFLKVHLLARPDRQIRPLILWELGGWFSDPFCHGADSLVGVVEHAALLAERLVDVLGAGKDLTEG